MIAPIKINTAIKEKTVIKNVSLGSVTVSTSSIDEFTCDDNDLSNVLILILYIYNIKGKK